MSLDLLKLRCMLIVLKVIAHSKMKMRFVMENQVSFEVFGKYALFTDPVTKIGGEKMSYHVPTYEALKGIIRHVYWKPTFNWFIDEVRIMNKIRTFTKGVKTLKYNDATSNGLHQYTYLVDVKYQVLAHFEWCEFRNDLSEDRNSKKHLEIANRMIKKGGRRSLFLGTTECQAFVNECEYGSGAGYYDGCEELSYGLMFHGFDYPTEIGKTNIQGEADENGKYRLHSRFFFPKMIDGKIKFLHPSQCTIKKYVHDMNCEQPRCNINNEDI